VLATEPVVVGREIGQHALGERTAIDGDEDLHGLVLLSKVCDVLEIRVSHRRGAATLTRLRL